MPVGAARNGTHLEGQGKRDGGGSQRNMRDTRYLLVIKLGIEQSTVIIIVILVLIIIDIYIAINCS